MLNECPGSTSLILTTVLSIFDTNILPMSGVRTTHRGNFQYLTESGSEELYR